ncbi:MAG: bifunctional [glutamine synthetase] adenylyltransferase/[glutamine synthetase]-adenylyl-L-tyrosine phosphorylase [Armatimonadota bacterium]
MPAEAADETDVGESPAKMHPPTSEADCAAERGDPPAEGRESPGAVLSDVRDLLLAPDLEEAAVAAALRAYGLADWRRADALLQSLGGEPESRQALAEALPELLRCLRDCPAPLMALGNWERLAQAVGDPAALYRRLTHDPRGLDLFTALASTSQFCADALVRNPEYLDYLLEPDALSRPRPAHWLLRDLRREVSALHTRRTRRDALRRFKRRELLRIAARDLLGLADLEMVVQEISDLAAAEVQVALDMCERDLRAKWGTPMAPSGPASIAVIAMGKLGGRELNYSSDIDLIFVYSDDGDCLPSATSTAVQRLSTRDFFDRLATATISALQEVTGEGMVFRVDMRLRPEGASGQLTRSFAATVNYYESWAQPWERQALVKAAPLAGDLELGRRLLDALQPFVYGKRLEAMDIAEIGAMRTRLEPRPGAAPEVKHGPGGIRDVEFAVQTLQLVVGVEDHAVRCSGTLPALRALLAGGHISQAEHDCLHDAYVFLRTLEHRLQMVHELPIRELPSDAEEADLLARRMGYRPRTGESPAEQLMTDFERHTSAVRATYEAILGALTGDSGPQAAEARLLLDPDLSPHEAAAIWGRYGVRDPKRAMTNLRSLAYGPDHAILSTRVQRQFLELLPAVLGAASRSGNPDLALDNLARFTSLIGSWGALYATFRDEPRVLELLCRVGGGSHRLSALLARHPEYLDALLDPDVMLADKSAQELRDEAHRRGASGDAGALRRFRGRELLRIGVRDLMGDADLQATMQALSELAEACLAAMVEACRRELEQRTGIARAPGGGPARFAVIGLGKLGARELHYSSDLDVIFVHEAAGCTDGPNPIANHEFFARLADHVLHEMNELGPEGRLYKVDARLRPEGRAGSLSMPLAGYVRYCQARAEPWERMALTRARPVAGDQGLGRRFVEETAPLVYRGLSHHDIASLRRIKARVEGERAQPATSEQLDIKLGPGGINDVEYVVQFLQLRHGGQLPAVRAAGTLEAIEALLEVSLVEEADARALREGYVFLRQVELGLQIVRERSEEVLSLDDEDLAMLAARLAHPGDSPQPPQRLRDDIRSTMARLREVFERIFLAG